MTLEHLAPALPGLPRSGFDDANPVIADALDDAGLLRERHELGGSGEGREPFPPAVLLRPGRTVATGCRQGPMHGLLGVLVPQRRSGECDVRVENDPRRVNMETPRQRDEFEVQRSTGVASKLGQFVAREPAGSERDDLWHAVLVVAGQFEVEALGLPIARRVIGAYREELRRAGQVNDRTRDPGASEPLEHAPHRLAGLGERIVRSDADEFHHAARNRRTDRVCRAARVLGFIVHVDVDDARGLQRDRRDQRRNRRGSDRLDESYRIRSTCRRRHAAQRIRGAHGLG